MELAQTLVRSVMRAFYETRHILVIDALILHSALRDDDLAYLMGMNTKDLHKLCAKLRDDRFLTVHTRPELKEGQQRPMSRTYYFIDYRQTIDAIKWRVYRIDKDMQGTAIPASERKEYFCPRCKSEWTQMEVLDSASPEGFRCHKCGAILTHDLDRNSVGHQKSTRMNNQFKFITDLLPRIDAVVVPESTFDGALAGARPVVRDHMHQVAASVVADVAALRPTAVKGLVNTGPKSMQVSISTGDGPSEAEKAAERARKDKIAQQNALPSWMANSTVTGESFSANGASTGAAGASGAPAIKEDHDADTKDGAAGRQAADAKDDAEVEAYFAQLRAQQAAEVARRAAAAQSGNYGDEFGSDYDDDEDEDGDFEDVVASGSSSAGGTPRSPAPGSQPNSTLPVVPSPLRQSSVPLNSNSSSRKRDASSASGTSTSAAPSPANQTQGSEDRPPKKVRVEEKVAPAAAAAAAGDDDESDEDVEFEDV